MPKGSVSASTLREIITELARAFATLIKWASLASLIMSCIFMAFVAYEGFVPLTWGKAAEIVRETAGWHILYAVVFAPFLGVAMLLFNFVMRDQPAVTKNFVPPEATAELSRPVPDSMYVAFIWLVGTAAVTVALGYFWNANAGLIIAPALLVVGLIIAIVRSRKRHLAYEAELKAERNAGNNFAGGKDRPQKSL